jgi:hypothetical protein
MVEDNIQSDVDTSQPVVDLGPMFASTLQTTSQGDIQTVVENLDSTADGNYDDA